MRKLLFRHCVTVRERQSAGNYQESIYVKTAPYSSFHVSQGKKRIRLIFYVQSRH